MCDQQVIGQTSSGDSSGQVASYQRNVEQVTTDVRRLGDAYVAVGCEHRLKPNHAGIIADIRA